MYYIKLPNRQFSEYFIEKMKINFKSKIMQILRILLIIFLIKILIGLITI